MIFLLFHAFCKREGGKRMNSLTISVELCSESVDLVGKAQGR